MTIKHARQSGILKRDRSQGEDLHIRLFGGFEIELSGKSRSHLLWQKSRALLAYLASKPGVTQSRQKLAEIFWPELAADAARSNLRQALMNLQRTLEDKFAVQPCLHVDRYALSFVPRSGSSVDVIAFMEQLPSCVPEHTQAECGPCLMHLEFMAGLYSEEFMAGLYLEGCPEFEEWLQVQRESLQLRALVLLEQITQCHERVGAYERALSSAWRYTELDPWNEEGHRRIMRLLAHNGQKAAALSQYETCCRLLNDELGVLPNDHTRELARSIQDGEFALAASPLPTRQGPIRVPGSIGEHRQVTVLYCSLSPASIDDPYEAMELLHGPQATCYDIVASFSGYAIKTNDGGFLAYFGYPEASERASLLAVRAALAIVGANFPGLELQLGLHSGLVITSSDPKLPDTVGKTTGTAIHLRMLAGPGEILISSALYSLVAGYVEVIRFAPAQLQGRQADEPEIFRLLGESGADHRLEAAERLAPLVGREDELSLLHDLWKKACRGKRQVLLLQGDPGIGKSRLVRQLRIQEQAHSNLAVMELRCLAELSQTPFAPLKGLFEKISGYMPADPGEVRFAALVRYVRAEYPETEYEVVPLFAAMLSLPLVAPYRSLRIPPREQRERIMALIIDRLHKMAGQQSLLLIVEDLHWIDMTTQELLLRFLQQPPTAPLLLLLTARPEFTPTWDKALAGYLRLAPLSDEQVRQLVVQRRDHLGPEMLKQVVQRADGVPLFAEELSRGLAKAGADVPEAVPMTLQDLLISRLDALGDARHTARLAATIGREFELELLVRLGFQERKPLLEALGKIQRAGLIEESAQGRFIFRHALFQDAVYQSQPRVECRDYHRRIAEVIETEFPEKVHECPERLAQHWASAGVPERAIEYRLVAARSASLHSAYREALMHLRCGLELAGKLRPGSLQVRLEFDLQIGLGWVFVALEGFASTAACEAFNHAITLSDQDDQRPDNFHALWGIWTSTSSIRDNNCAQKLAKKLLGMAQQSREPIQNQQGHFALGNTLFWQGQFAESHHHLARAVHLYQPDQHSTHIACYGENGGVSSRAYLSWTLWSLGFADQARRISNEALQLAEEIDHPFSLAYGLTFAMVLHRHLRQPEKTLELANRVLELAHIHDFPLWQAGATLKRGWAQVMLGEREGIIEMRQSLDSMRLAMSGITLIFQETLADALCHLGRYEEAEELIAEAQAEGQRVDDHHAEAELYRLQAECQIFGNQRQEEQAEHSLQQAIRISRTQQARIPQLRATMALAHLWQSQGHIDQAHQLLAEIYASFSEGFGTLDMLQAAQLMAELQESN